MIFEDTHKIRDALLILDKFKRVYAPLCKLNNGTGTVDYYGLVCLNDILSHLVNLFDKVLPSNLVGMYYQSQIFLDTPIINLIHYSTSFSINNCLHVMKNSSLFGVIGVFQKGIYRIAVRDDAGRVVNVLDTMDVIKFLISLLESKIYDDIYSKTIAELGIGYQDAWTIKDTEPTIIALRTIHLHGLIAIAVVNGNNQLIDSFDAGDLISLFLGSVNKRQGDSLFHCFFRPVGTFLQYKHQYVKPAISFTLEMPFYYLLLQLASRQNGLLGCWIIDSKKRPIGCITLPHIMKALINIKQEDRKA